MEKTDLKQTAEQLLKEVNEQLLINQLPSLLTQKVINFKKQHHNLLSNYHKFLIENDNCVVFDTLLNELNNKLTELENKRFTMNRYKKETKKLLIDKKTVNVFGNEYYLLGKLDKDYIYLQKQSWDCGWYWGAGYINSFTDNISPEKSRDISMHTHFDSLVFKKIDNNYIYHLNELPTLTETALNESESWELADLLKSVYTLINTAELFHRGGSNLTTNKDFSLKDTELEKHINTVILPSIFEQITKLLTTY